MTVDPLVVALLVSLIVAAFGWGFALGSEDKSTTGSALETVAMTCLFFGSCGVIVTVIAGFLIAVGVPIS